MSVMKLNKIMVAEKQLDMAIELWFNEKDPVSIHTLASSAYQIIQDINTRKCGRDLLYDSLVIKEEYRKDFVNVLKKEYNFFKHADKDYDEIIEFETEKTESFILFSCLGLELLGVKHSKIRNIFLQYFPMIHSEFATEKYKKEFLDRISDESKKIVRDMKKIDFYNYFMEISDDR